MQTMGMCTASESACIWRATTASGCGPRGSVCTSGCASRTESQGTPPCSPGRRILIARGHRRDAGPFAGRGCGEYARMSAEPVLEDPDVSLRTEVTELLRRLIACDTSNPPGREA